MGVAAERTDGIKSNCLVPPTLQGIRLSKKAYCCVKIHENNLVNWTALRPRGPFLFRSAGKGSKRGRARGSWGILPHACFSCFVLFASSKENEVASAIPASQFIVVPEQCKAFVSLLFSIRHNLAGQKALTKRTGESKMHLKTFVPFAALTSGVRMPAAIVKTGEKRL